MVISPGLDNGTNETLWISIKYQIMLMDFSTKVCSVPGSVHLAANSSPFYTLGVVRFEI